MAESRVPRAFIAHARDFGGHNPARGRAIAKRGTPVVINAMIGITELRKGSISM